MMINDDKLIELLKEENHEVFKLFYKENYKMIFSIAYKFTDNREDAEEIMQETFVRVFKNIKKFNPRNNFSLKKWIIKICSNISIDYLRKRKVETIFKLKFFRKYSEIKTPEKSFQKMELKEKIDKAISMLSPKQRVAFTLKYIEEYSIKEIANIMNSGENTVKKHLQRAMDKVRKYLKKKEI